MSPEQVRRKELDVRTDLFSFGTLVYEMCTGRLPFRGRTSGVIFKAILDSTPTPAMRINPDVPAELERIIDKALEKDREVRCQSAAEVRADLKRLMRDTTSGKIESADPAASRRRSRWLWAVAALILIVAGIFAWLNSSPSLPKVDATTQLTRDGIPKLNVVSDGSRVYVTERGNSNQIIQVSVNGGETSMIPTPLTNALAVSVSPDYTQLLLRSHIGTAQEVTFWSLPLPSGKASSTVVNVLRTGA